jgi:outer membrane protein OmpA-like peptidoglycan-associated protein
MLRFGCRRVRLSAALVALAALSYSPRIAAAELATLELFHGPDETGAMVLKNFRIVLDGKDLQIPTPTAEADAAKPIFRGQVAAGIHKLEVEALLEATPSVFSYMEGYRLKVRSKLQVEVLPAEGVSIRSRIMPKTGVTVPWQERNRLVITLAPVAHDPAQPTDVASASPAPAPAAEGASPAAPSAPAPAVAVAPEPVAAPAPLAAPAAEPAPEPRAAPVEAAPAPVPVAVATSEAARPRAASPTARAPAAPAPAPSAPLPAAPRAAQVGCSLEPVRFEFDKSTLTADAERSLDRFAACLAMKPRSIRLEGHADARGSDQLNEWFGDERARAVAAYLREKGVDARRLSTRYFGKSRPLCTEATEDCYARNRRVEAIPLD